LDPWALLPLERAHVVFGGSWSIPTRVSYYKKSEPDPCVPWVPVLPYERERSLTHSQGFLWLFVHASECLNCEPLFFSKQTSLYMYVCVCMYIYIHTYIYYCILLVQRGFIVIFPYMHRMCFDQMHCSVTLSYCPPIFLNHFSGFHYAIFLHAQSQLFCYTNRKQTIHLEVQASRKGSCEWAER
jgi:hypothetical protein